MKLCSGMRQFRVETDFHKDCEAAASASYSESLGDRTLLRINTSMILLLSSSDYNGEAAENTKRSKARHALECQHKVSKVILRID